MDVIHFTHGATDPLIEMGAKGVRFLPLADGFGDSHIGCAHFERGATLDAPSISHAAALLIVHGRITITTKSPRGQIQFFAGMGAIFREEEQYSLASDTGAILLIVEAQKMAPQKRGISSPNRIAGQRWPGDDQTVRVQDLSIGHLHDSH